jgi:hypothetical protein
VTAQLVRPGEAHPLESFGRSSATEVHAVSEQHVWPTECRVMVLMVVRTARDG